MSILLFLGIIMLFLNFLMSEYYKTYISESSLFECGFESLYWFHNKISSHFFKIGIIFILFDLEIMYLLLIINNSSVSIEIWTILTFLLSTLYLEMYFYSLLWSYYL